MNELDFERPIIELENEITKLEELSGKSDMNLSGHIRELRENADRLRREIFANLTPWQRVMVARHPDRPLTTHYLDLICDDFYELHGDRFFGDDRAIVTGLARIGGQKLLVVGHRRGRTTKERLECNFGCPHPEGYRKALRKMKLAEKYHLPIVTLINTPGAYPGIGAEERGQATAIAENLFEMSKLRTIVICIVIGEGGSGGALGIGVGDRMLILENAFFSVISPEGCAAILWKERDKAADAAAVLKLAPKDLYDLGIVDEIVPEPMGGAHRNHKEAAQVLKRTILRHLDELTGVPIEELLERRYAKYRAIGRHVEEQEAAIEAVAAAPAPEESPEAEEAAAKEVLEEAPQVPPAAPERKP